MTDATKDWRVGRPTPADVALTPRRFYARLEREFGFKLDAACFRSNCLAPSGIYHDEGRNALEEDWSKLAAGAPVWCNPPYSNLRPWIQKCRLEGMRGVVVALVPADPSTAWWRTVRYHATEVRFVEGRLRFVGQTANEFQSRSPSAVVVFSPMGGPPAYSYIAAREQPRALFDDITSGPATRGSPTLEARS